jgi:carnitine O-acetyltransferase
LQLAEGSALRALHRELEEREAKAVDPSFVSVGWDMMYLKGRWPLPINSNPGTVTPTATFGDARTQVARAARLAAAATDFALRIAEGSLTPDVFKGVVLDMRQYPRMFSSTRLPVAGGADTWHKAPPERSRHMVVLRGTSFWKVR